MNWQKERFFELIVIISPEYSDQIDAMSDGYRNLIEENNGRITRYEDWGLRNLAYQIDKHRKGYYLLLNFACSSSKLIDSLKAVFDSDNPALRMLLTRTRNEVSELSPVKLEKELQQEKQEEAKV